MSERARDRDEDRDSTRAPGARQKPAEEYTDYRQVDPDAAGADKEEAVEEADLQPGTPKSKRDGEDQPRRRSSS